MLCPRRSGHGCSGWKQLLELEGWRPSRAWGLCVPVSPPLPVASGGGQSSDFAHGDWAGRPAFRLVVTAGGREFLPGLGQEQKGCVTSQGFRLSPLVLRRGQPDSCSEMLCLLLGLLMLDQRRRAPGWGPEGSQTPTHH